MISRSESFESPPAGRQRGGQRFERRPGDAITSGVVRSGMRDRQGAVDRSRWMVVGLVAIAAVLLATWPEQLSPAQEALVGEAAPDFSATTLGGDPIGLEDLRGKVVVLDFWATWCPPCVVAIPHIQKLKDGFAGRAVAFVGMNLDGPGTRQHVQHFLADRGIDVVQVLDERGTVARQYGVSGIPCLVLIDPQGKVAHIQTGFSSDLESSLSARITGLLPG